MHSARSQSASLFGLTLNNLVRVVSGTPGLGRPHPLGSQKVMGSFAGCAVSGGTFEIVRLFFQRRFFSSAVAISWIAFCWTPSFFPRLRTSYSSPCTLRSTFPLLQDFLDVTFFRRGLVYSFGHHKTFSAVIDQKRFFSMPEEDFRWMKKPDHAFHARRHRPRRRHREPHLVAPRTQIWLSHTHFPWQT